MAVSLAAIAVILDSAILVVGAMVVGPEFSAVGAVAVAVAFGRWRLAGRGFRLVGGGGGGGGGGVGWGGGCAAFGVGGGFVFPSSPARRGAHPPPSPPPPPPR